MKKYDEVQADLGGGGSLDLAAADQIITKLILIERMLLIKITKIHPYYYTAVKHITILSR
jgi:hypothetical protein